ncbi:RnfH family protein [Conchiformibius steedae]|uniref:UPF0125 protein EII21_05595 n=1 Tax=Conchiformibius steedae TaxID=153493 RepID=A0A3P2A4M0_9NEIS|nr:RnfH family protein [Conchiformibius steedae]RRD90391.1 RnfH family protein [Conchiformibius steedae]
MADIDIEIAYACPEKQVLYRLRVPAGTTVRHALHKSPLAQDFPELDTNGVPLGIFGKRADDHTVLQAHDRIEVYRALIADPKQARRKRAAQAKQHQA